MVKPLHAGIGARNGVVAALLAERRRDPELFADGSYERLSVSGPAVRHVVAFARRYHNRALIVAVGRFFARLDLGPDDLCPSATAWAGTTVSGRGKASLWRNVLTSTEVIPAGRRGFAADALFREVPAAVLVSEGW